MEKVNPTTEDRRKRKTRHAIQTALLSLLKEKPLEKISITELAERSDINRKTFYNHYNTIQEVRREMDEEYLNLIFEYLRTDMPESIAEDDLTGVIHKIVQALEKDPLRSRLLFESGEPEYLVEQVNVLIRPYLQKMAREYHFDGILAGYVIEFIVHGIIAVLHTWVSNIYPIQSKDLEQVLGSLVDGAIHELRQTYPQEEIQKLPQEEISQMLLPMNLKM